MTTPACADYADLLPRAARGQLAAADQARLAAHLVTCAGCQATLRAHQTLDAALTRYVTRPSEYPHLTEDIMASLNQEARDHAARRAPRAAFTGIMPWAAVALIALLAALIFTSRFAPTTPGSGKGHTPSQTICPTPTPSTYTSGTPTVGPTATPATAQSNAARAPQATFAPVCAPTPTPTEKPGPTPTPGYAPGSKSGATPKPGPTPTQHP